VSGIVVAVDGSPGAADAVALAALLSDALDAPTILACVHPPRALSARITGTAFEDRDADGAQRIVDAVAWPSDRPAPERRVVWSATPALGLRMVADHVAADLVVVGSSHRHGLGRAVPGTTAMRLVADRSRPIAIAAVGHAGARQAMQMQHIGIAYDGSPAARRALTFAVGLARRTDAWLRVFDVAVPRTPLELACHGPAAAPLIGLEPARAEARANLTEALATIPSDIAVNSELLDGDPSSQLVDLSSRLDLLIMGSRGHGLFERLLLGSTSDAVAAGTRCPLVVVPGD
jgi:nucleotide-binding universal stress UspA family protein